MPHLISGYSDTPDFDVKAVFTRLYDGLVAINAIKMKGFKSSAVRRSKYLTAGFRG